jgi:hypothetical protein
MITETIRPSILIPSRCRKCTCALVISVVALLSCARGALRDRPLAKVFQRFLQGAGFRNVTPVEVEGPAFCISPNRIWSGKETSNHPAGTTIFIRAMARSLSSARGFKIGDDITMILVTGVSLSPRHSLHIFLFFYA